MVKVLVVVGEEQQLFLQQLLEFLQEFQAVVAVDADSVFLDGNLADDVAYILLVDIHFQFVHLKIVGLDNDLVFVGNFAAYFVDIFVAALVVIDQLVDLVGLVDYNFDFFDYSFCVDILLAVDILVAVDLVDFDCNNDAFDGIVDFAHTVDFAHIVDFVHIVVGFEVVDIAVDFVHIADHIVVDKLAVVQHNKQQVVIVVVVVVVEFVVLLVLQYCSNSNIR